MTEVTPINALQGLWVQHKDIKERIGNLADRVYTFSYYLMDEFKQRGRRLNSSEEGIVLIEIIEESCKEMKVLIERMDKVRDEIDKIEGNSLMQVPLSPGMEEV